ncbi:transmembrane domain protein [Halobacterium phage ChaoS9]|uniref:Transmembrane domain protein n=1 Tax=Halobacterium phage ChaoS9 TaxID=2847105 RepID=A0A481V9G9_9CAUD|nr:transmembrane domain protein [Halobacterium phage ChaoS9]QBI90045.1 transmembrane domain protein [Halobacterium phage ChaoS9]
MSYNSIDLQTVVAQTGTALDEISRSEPLTIAAPLFIILATYVLFYEGLLWTVGSDGWRGIRSQLPLLDEVADSIGAYTHYEIDPEKETVGTLEADVDEAVDHFQEELGYLDGPVAAHKGLPDGREEVASLVKYGFEKYDIWFEAEVIEGMPKGIRFLVMLLIPNQRHVTLFEGDEPGEVLVTAHQEYSAHSVLFAYWHMIGKGMDIDRGVREVVDELKEDERFEASSRAKDLWLEWLKSPQ